MLTIGAVTANELSIRSSIDSLGRLFAIVIALAIGEAFKQFVSDKAEKPEHRHIHWDRFPALVAFLFLVVPFWHGMARYFFETYQEATRSSPYSTYLIIDCLLFTIEAGLFFTLSRSLPMEQCRRFYIVVELLLAVDVIWGLVTLTHDSKAVKPWIAVNSVAFFILLACLVLFRRAKSHWPVVIIAMLIVIGRTVADYGFSFRYYFPPQ